MAETITWESKSGWTQASGGKAGLNWFGVATPGSTTTEFTLNEFQIMHEIKQNDNQNCYIAIAKSNSTSSLSTSEVVAVSNNQILPTAIQLYTYSFDNEVKLQGGTTYYIVFLTSNVATDGAYPVGQGRVALNHTSYGTYAPGCSYSGGATWWPYFKAELTSTVAMINVTYNLYESDGTTLVSSEVASQEAGSTIAIPASITSSTYYDYSTEGTIGNADCTIKVIRTLKSEIVYPISNLSNSKAYTLTTSRGSLGTNGTQMVSTFGTSYSASNFAIISYEDNYYLYSVADSKFVGNPSTINNVQNQPGLTNDISAVTPVSFSLTTAPLYFMGMGSNGVNVSNYDTGIVVNNWTTRDAGNQYIIEEAADFDATAALAVLEDYFHPSYFVTYVVKDVNGNTLLTSDPVGTTLGAQITTLPSEYQLTNFYEYNTQNVTISEQNTTVEFTATLKDAPNFKFTADATSPVWYKLKMKNANYPTYVADGTPNVTLPTTDANNETVQWAFVGNPYAGFTIINRAAGADLVLGSASAADDGANGGNTYVTLAAAGTQTYEKFFAYHSGQLTNGFFLFNAQGHAMNQRSTANLAYWTGGYDLGSTFVAEEVLEGEALYNELLAAVKAINYGAGVGQYVLTGSLAGYAGQEAALIAMIESTYGGKDYVAGAEALQSMIDNKALNMPTVGFYRIKGNTSGKYLAAGLASNNKFAMTDATDATTVFCFDGSTLVNMSTGKSNGMSTSAWAWVNAEGASAVEFQDGLTNGGYAINSAAAYFYDNGDNTSSADRGGNLTINSSTNARYTSWQLEAVTDPISVEVSSVGYATLFAPVALTIPAGVKAYYVSAIAANQATLTEIETTIPANTGVILTAAAGSYDFEIATVAGTAVTNLLSGTTGIRTYGNEFTLQDSDEGVGLFSKAPNSGELAGFKAFLPAANVPAEVKGLIFDFETAIQTVGANQNADKAIFDLSGRRVQKTVKGLYIVNGKKVVIK